VSLASLLPRLDRTAARALQQIERLLDTLTTAATTAAA